LEHWNNGKEGYHILDSLKNQYSNIPLFYKLVEGWLYREYLFAIIYRILEKLD
jgi:hypothetical protein